MRESKFEEFKHFVERNKNVLIIISVAVVALVLITSALGLTIRVNFLLGNELLVQVEPEEVSLQTFYGDESKVEFVVSSNNLPYCTASCSYTFQDKGKGEIVEQGDFNLGYKEVFAKEYTITASRIGAGQDLYGFDVVCQNQRTFICLTDAPQRFKSSLVVLNYDLSEQEKVLKDILQQQLTLMLQKLAEVDVEVKNVQEKVFLISDEVEVTSLLEETAALENEFAEINVNVDIYRGLWEAEEYISLSEVLDQDIMGQLKMLAEHAASLEGQLIGSVENHNSLLFSFLEIKNQVTFMEDVFLVAEKHKKGGIQGQVEEIIAFHNTLVDQFFTKSFENYEILNESIHEFENRIENLRANYTSLAEDEFVASSLILAREQDALCVMQNISPCNVNKTIPSLDGAFSSLNVLTPLLGNACGKIQELETAYSQLQTIAKEELHGQNITVGANQAVQWRNHFVQEVQEKYKESNNNSFFETTIDEWASFSSLNSSINQTERLAVFSSIELLDELALYEQESCSLGVSPPSLSNTTLEKVEIPIVQEMISGVETELSANPPICCLFGECGECCTSEECRNNPETFPVIFLHGHAFNKGNAPDYSLDGFNLIQNRLEEEGYLNAGIITPATQLGSHVGEWGLSGRPVSVKASYYFDQFLDESRYIVVPTKSENIDTYALRLRDIVDVVKERTGKPKVNIVAHSMGGLVTRKYMQIFGDLSVNKLIMIATPNKGVEGTLTRICPLFGEQKECVDMAAGSLFLNKVNDPSKQPENVQLFTITGVGCDTNGEQGDGVVIGRNVLLDNTANFNVTGKCEGLLGETFHTEILDINKYPKVFKIIEQVLRNG